MLEIDGTSWMTIKEAAKLTGLTDTMVRYGVRKGEVASRRTSPGKTSTFLVSADSLNKYIRERMARAGTVLEHGKS